ncbi:MAG: hypothetical protein WCD27_16235, partial [Candidatus Acidiferrales bacterium]
AMGRALRHSMRRATGVLARNHGRKGHATAPGPIDIIRATILSSRCFTIRTGTRENQHAIVTASSNGGSLR